MVTVSSLVIGRFKQLAQRTDEVWQGALVALPMWADNPADPARPIRPTGAVWRSLRSGRLHVVLVEGDAAGPSVAFDALVEFAKQESKLGGSRPSRVEVRDPTLRDALAAALEGTHTSVVLVPDLPAVNEALRDLERMEGDPPPGYLDGKGVTVERVGAFADAAAVFHRAAIWRHLGNDDLIVVEAPVPPTAMSHLCVLGHGGQQFGLAFFASRAAFDKVLAGDPRRADRAHGLTFDPPDGVPFADLDLWAAHGLPLAAPNAYPFFAELSRSGLVRRPEARALTLAEALLRALGDTTEADLDAGRWQREVTTFDGRVTVALALPDVLEAAGTTATDTTRPSGGPLLAERVNAPLSRLLSERSFASIDDMNAAVAAAREAGLLDADAAPGAGLDRALTPLEQAQEIVYQAHESSGRRRIRLARSALALSEDCADAWSLLAEAAPTADEAATLYAKAVEAGRRIIGEHGFETRAGHFWSDLSTRPYMRARAALAQTLVDLERFDEAIAHYEGLLGLNPDDNQGCRHLLLPVLLECGRHDAARALLDRYGDDAGTEWAYGRALLAFRADGDTEHTRATLLAALTVNRHVALFLVSPEGAPEVVSPHVTLGGRDEAVHVSDAFALAFENTPGALEWLKREAVRAPHRSPSKRTSRRHTRR